MDKIQEKIFRPIGQLGVVVMILMVLLIVFDVGGRFFFNRPVIGAVEIVELQNVLLCFFALVWCTLNKEHLNVTILEKFIPEKVKAVSDNIFYLAAAVFYSLLCIQNMKITYKYISKGAESVVLKIPLLPIYFIIGFSCLCVVIILVMTLINNIILAVKK